jgi:hypothetical protein
VNVFYELFDAVAAASLEPFTEESIQRYRLLKGIEPISRPLLPAPDPTEQMQGALDDSGKATAKLGWKDEARSEADKIHLASMASGYRLGVEDVAIRVAEKLAERGIESPRGELTAKNILREALQGERWKRPKLPTGETGEIGKLKK